MKKIFAFLALSLILNVTFASVVVTSPRLKTSEIFLLLGSTGQRVSLLDLSTIKIKELEQLRRTKMSFGERLTFKVSQKKLRDNIGLDGSIDMKKIQKAIKKQQRDRELGFHLGGFAFGFLLGQSVC